MNEYRSLRNKINILVRGKRKQYFKNKFSESKNSTKILDLFNELNNFRSKTSPPISKLVEEDGTVVEDKDDICELLANEYVVQDSLGNLAELNKTIVDYDKNYVPSEFELNSEVLPAEILSVIKKIKNAKRK